jgi:hypothetical protein
VNEEFEKKTKRYQTGRQKSFGEGMKSGVTAFVSIGLHAWIENTNGLS